MIELKKETRVLAFWFAEGEIGGKRGNYMACLQKTAENYQCDYRFRWFKDEKIFDSDDDRNWYRFTADLDQTEDEIVATMNEKLMPVISMIGPVEYIPVFGNGEYAGKVLSEQLFAHARPEEPENT